MRIFSPSQKVAILSHRCSRAIVAKCGPPTAKATCQCVEPLVEADSGPTRGQRGAITVPRVVIHTDPRLWVAIICICLVETKRSQTAYFQSEPKGGNLRIFSPIQRSAMSAHVFFATTILTILKNPPVPNVRPNTISVLFCPLLSAYVH